MHLLADLHLEQEHNTAQDDDSQRHIEGADLESLFPGSCEGVNGRGTVGYIGPKPPIGTHRYFFKVFAVDTVLSFNEPPELKDVFNAIDGRVVQMAETMGTYKLQF